MPTHPLGKVLALFISSTQDSKRVSKKTLSLSQSGVLGDKFYDKDIKRSVLISSKGSYELAKKHHIMMKEGSLGENILMDFNPYKLPSGTQIQIGNAIVQITQVCTICEHLSLIDATLPTLLKEDRGIFAQVVQEGTIQEGDTISLLGALSMITFIKKHIKKLNAPLKDEDEVIMILKKRLTKKEFKILQYLSQDMDESQQRDKLSLTQERYDAVKTKALKKINFHELKEELMQKEA
jgi:MOSC domain-containing protein YiiM